jgi:hypothetical protein
LRESSPMVSRLKAGGSQDWLPHNWLASLNAPPAPGRPASASS